MKEVCTVSYVRATYDVVRMKEACAMYPWKRYTWQCDAMDTTALFSDIGSGLHLDMVGELAIRLDS